MKSSILIIIFDFFVCSLLLTVSFGSGPGSGRGIAPRDGAASTATETATASEFTEASVNAELNDRIAEYKRTEKEQIAQANPPGIPDDEAKKLQIELDEEKRKAAALAEDKKKAEEAAKAANKAAEDAKNEAAVLAGEKKKAEEAGTAAVEASAEAKKAIEDLKKKLAEANAATKQAQSELDVLKRENEDLKIAAQPPPTPPATGGSMSGGGSGGQGAGGPSSSGGSDALLASRVEVKVGITEYDSFVRGGDDLFDRTFYPVAFKLNDRAYLITKSEDFSLGWDGWSERNPDDVRRFSFVFSKRGPDPQSTESKADLMPLSGNPKLVLAPLPTDLISFEPLQVLGEEVLGKGLIFDGIIYKTSNEGYPMTVRFQRDNSNGQQVMLVSDAVTPKEAKEALKPELGDYLVTFDLRLAAIMLDERHGLIVTPKLLESTDSPIGLGDPAKFIEAEKVWLEKQEE